MIKLSVPTVEKQELDQFLLLNCGASFTCVEIVCDELIFKSTLEEIHRIQLLDTFEGKSLFNIQMITTTVKNAATKAGIYFTAKKREDGQQINLKEVRVLVKKTIKWLAEWQLQIY